MDTRSSMKRSWVTRTRPPVELGQAVLQHLERRDVEVVGGLVEDQQVGGLAHQPRDQDAGLLAAGEAADRQLELLGPEQEALGPRGHVDAAALVDDGVALGRQRAAQRSGRGRGSPRSCSKRTSRRPSARSISPASGGERAGEQVEQRGLAAAVRADEADAGAGRDRADRDRGRARRPPSAFDRPARRRGALRVRRSEAVKSIPAVGGGAAARASSSSLDQAAGLLDAALGLGGARLGARGAATRSRGAPCWRATPGRRPGRAGTRRGGPGTRCTGPSVCEEAVRDRRGSARACGWPRARGSSGRGSRRGQARARSASTPSSQRMPSTSRWLVGSSISRMSGAAASSRAMASRFCQPPESVATSARPSAKPARPRACAMRPGRSSSSTAGQRGQRRRPRRCRPAGKTGSCGT